MRFAESHAPVEEKRIIGTGWLLRNSLTGRVSEAIFVGFTLELLRSTQSCDAKWPHPFDFSICVPRERLKFGGDQPTHANVIVYVGGDVQRFEMSFSALGRCK